MNQNGDPALGPALGDVIRHRDGWSGRIVDFSPDRSIVDVVNLETGRKITDPLFKFELPTNPPPPLPGRVILGGQKIRVAMGPIIGAILIANFITGLIAAALYVVFR